MASNSNSTNCEIDSFTTKFKLLLKHGRKATLTFDTIDGEVFATLKAGLGSNFLSTAVVDNSLFTQNNRDTLNRKSRSPAYIRRQERRRFERQQIVLKEETEKSEITEDDIAESEDANLSTVEAVQALKLETENVFDSSNDVDVDIQAETAVLSNESEVQNDEESLDDVDHKALSTDVIVEEPAESSKIASGKVAEVVKASIEDSSEKNIGQDDIAHVQNNADKSNGNESKPTTMWTLISLDKCGRSSLNSSDFRAVQEIFTRFEHLKKNIVKLEIGNFRSRRENEVFCHDLSMKVLVDSS